MKRQWFVLGMLAGMLGGIATPWAQETRVSVDVKTADGVRYYSGGVGADERALLPQRFPLKLVFATQKGHYLTGVQVTVSARGKRLATVTADRGPWLFLDLKPGTYRIQATYRGVTRSRQVKVAAKGMTTVYFHWPATEAIMGK